MIRNLFRWSRWFPQHPPVRWGGRDRDLYFGPFTLTTQRARHGRQWGVMYRTVGGDDYSEDPRERNALRLEIGWFTLHVLLPAWLKALRVHHASACSADGYWESYRREYGFTFFEEYGFTFFEGALHVHYGAQTNDSDTDKSKVFFYPWSQHTRVRLTLLDPEGQPVAHIPVGRYDWGARRALEAVQPAKRFEFMDYDSALILATCRINEVEYRRGVGIFRLLFLGRNKVSRTMEVRFSAEVGPEKGSWKGGTVGHSDTIAPGESLETRFRLYCRKNNLVFSREITTGDHTDDNNRPGTATVS